MSNIIQKVRSKKCYIFLKLHKNVPYFSLCVGGGLNPLRNLFHCGQYKTTQNAVAAAPTPALQ